MAAGDSRRYARNIGFERKSFVEARGEEGRMEWCTEVQLTSYFDV